MKNIETIYSQYGKSTNLRRKEALAKFEWVCIAALAVFASAYVVALWA